MDIYINSIMKNPSLSDGPGYRTVLFLQGCNIRCRGCQNKSTWDMQKGTRRNVSSLAEELRQRCFNKKLTISGGEPLMQADAVEELLSELSDFDLCLYTGHDINEVPKSVLNRLKYLKYGPFEAGNKTTVIPFVGSTNQKFIEVIHGDDRTE